MSIEEAMFQGIVFKGKKETTGKEVTKVKTKAKKAKYIKGLHGSASAKMKLEIRQKRANRKK